MSILAQYQNMIVEVLDVYTNGAGVKWASVEAQDGEPFIGGDKWPVRGRFGTVRVCDLSKAQEPSKPNLLDWRLTRLESNGTAANRSGWSATVTPAHFSRMRMASLP